MYEIRKKLFKLW